MNKKDMLKAKARPVLATRLPQDNSKALVVKGSELDRITYAIKSDIAELNDIKELVENKKSRVDELKKNIVEKLIYIRDNKKKLLPERNLEDYIINDLGITKGYFYENIKAYEFVKELNAPERFEEVDYKLLAGISRFKDDSIKKALLSKSPELSREDLKYFKDNEDDISVKDVRKYAGRTFTDAEVIELAPVSGRKSPAKLAIALIKEYTLKSKQKGNIKSKNSLAFHQMALGIFEFSKSLKEEGYLSATEFKEIVKLKDALKGS